MSDNLKYYYLKLKDDFFYNDEVALIEGIDDGYKYICILLKLYLKSLKYNGKLMYNENTPYTLPMLSKILRVSLADLEMAFNLFTKLNLIEQFRNGDIYMSNIQNYIGKSSTEADRKRIYRSQIEQQRLLDKCPDNSPPEKEIKTEIEQELNQNIYLQIIDLYNKVCTRLNPASKSLYPQRLEKIDKLLSLYTLQEIEDIFKKANKSDFLCGKVNDFKATFDFIINPANATNILENKYSVTFGKNQEKRKVNHIGRDYTEDFLEEFYDNL